MDWSKLQEQELGAEPLIIQYNKELATKFDMKDIGLMHYYLGLEVWQKRGEVFLGQGKYVVKILQKFGMIDCKYMATPMVTDMRKLRLWFWSIRLIPIMAVDWLIDVFGEYLARHLLCYEHIEPVPGGT